MSQFKPKGKERRNLENLIFGSGELKPTTVKADATRTNRLRFPRMPDITPPTRGAIPLKTSGFEMDKGIFGPTKKKNRSRPVRRNRLNQG